MIKIKTINESEFISINIEGKIAEQTTLIANQLGISLKNVSYKIRVVDNIILVDDAYIPTKSTKPNIILNISLAFFLGFIFQ